MKKILFLGLAGILAIAVTSCKSDEIADLGPKPLEEDQSFFANIEVCGTGAMTRADEHYQDTPYDSESEPEFDEGDVFEPSGNRWDENAVATIYLIFYDDDGHRVATTQVRKNNNNTAQTDELTPSENSYYKGVVQIDVKHGSLPPASVMAFINPITSSNFEVNPSFATLEALGHTTRPRLIDDAGFFAMSKSSYYKDLNADKPGEAPNYQRVIATPLTPDQLKPTAAEAEAERDSKNAVKIFVERYAAKVTFELKEEEPEVKLYDTTAGAEVNDEDKITLQFQPEYWAVNAYESETYITKSFYTKGENNAPSGDILKFTYLNKVLGGTEGNDMPWHWNSTEYHRCYWAQSPAYYSNLYPRTGDDVVEQPKGHYALGYYSYNDMKEEAAENGKTAIGKSRLVSDNLPIYARENTISGDAMIEAYKDPMASPKASIASVVLVGRYNVRFGGTSGDFTPIPKNEYLYVMGNATNGYTVYESSVTDKKKDKMLSYFVGSTVRFAADEEGKHLIFNYSVVEESKRTFATSYEDYAKYFKIEHPSKEVRNYNHESKDADVVLDSRFVTIQLDTDAIRADKINTDTGKGLYAYLDGEWVKVDVDATDTINHINQQMFYTAGTVQAFKDGLAYYTIPIKHLGFYRNGNYNNDPTRDSPNKKGFDWEQVSSGDFGLVRNHSYKIIVDDINGLGNAIPDPDVPIVPPTDPEEYFIGARIIVLNWAVVPAQHEIL